jgi:MFS superfamily sulfate permease-like transporter
MPATALVLLFLTEPLRYLPGSALGAVLISAGIGLFDWRALVRFYRIQEGEFLVCVAAMLGVMTLGALEGIALSIALAMLVLLVRSSRPADSVLGRVEGLQGFHDLARHEGAAIVPGLILYRFTASVIFSNAPYFRRCVLAVADANPGATWLIVDGALDRLGADAVFETFRAAVDACVPQTRTASMRS